MRLLRRFKITTSPFPSSSFHSLSLALVLLSSVIKIHGELPEITDFRWFDPGSCGSGTVAVEVLVVLLGFPWG